MNKKQYIRVQEIRKDKKEDAGQQDKIARLYALAQKLHVKIGG